LLNKVTTTVVARFSDSCLLPLIVRHYKDAVTVFCKSVLLAGSQDRVVGKERQQANESARREQREDVKARRRVTKLDKQNEKILVVDDKRAMRAPVQAIQDRKDPDPVDAPVPKPSTTPLLAPGLNGGEARWKSHCNTADICPKEIQ